MCAVGPLKNLPHYALLCFLLLKYYLEYYIDSFQPWLISLKYENVSVSGFLVSTVSLKYPELSILDEKDNHEIEHELKPKKIMAFIGNIDLSNSDDYQALYASQLYGTFFSVYGKFTCKIPADGETALGKEEYMIDKIDFKIINYKGLLNLGISAVNMVNAMTYDDVLFENGRPIRSVHKTIELEVQALCENKDFNYSGLNTKIKRKELLILERTLKPIHNGMAMENEVFDDEFYYREGLAGADGKFPSRPPIVDKPDTKSNVKNKAMMFPGTKCPRAINRIV